MATTDLDRMLADGLHRRAEDGPPVDPALVLRAATARGRRIRTRRRIATTIVAAVTVVGISAVGVLAQRRPDTGPPLREPSPIGSVYRTGDVGRMPAAPGEPGATADPGAVGTDPTHLHFSVDDLARDAEMAVYRSEPGFEAVAIATRNPRYVVDVVIARTEVDLERGVRGALGRAGAPEPATIGGVAGTLRQSEVYQDGTRDFLFVWQPVAGLWAGLRTQAATAEEVGKLLPGVRLDQARRCAVPFRFGRLPTGTRMESCTVTLSAGNDGLFRDGYLGLGDGDRTLLVGASNSPDSGDYPRPLRAGPYRVFADPDGRSWTMKTDGIFFDLLSSKKPRYSRADALAVIGGIVLAADKADPTTW